MNTLRLEIINLQAPYKVLQFVRWFNIYERRHLFIIRFLFDPPKEPT